MSGWTRGSLFAALKAAGLASALGLVLVLSAAPALADPDPAPGDPGVVAPPAPPADPPAPPPLAAPPQLPFPAPPAPGVPPVPGLPPAPDPLAVPVFAGPVAGQDPTPFTGAAPFGPPRLLPVNASTVGVGQPIIINFPGRVDDAGAAENAVHVSSVPPVPGKFYWMTPTQLRWRPLSFWPAHTAVTVDAGGTVSSFHTGDTLVATADDATHQLTVTRNGTVEKTFPMSMGMAAGGHQTANGTYYVQEKMPSVVMDSSTYGVPVNSTYGYKVTVDLAVRFDNSGNFVHSAPWSVDDQGKRDVSHGCINISPTNAKWFFDNFGAGDPIIVKNSVGTYTKNDGSNDWMS